MSIAILYIVDIGDSTFVVYRDLEVVPISWRLLGTTTHIEYLHWLQNYYNVIILGMCSVN